MQEQAGVFWLQGSGIGVLCGNGKRSEAKSKHLARRCGGKRGGETMMRVFVKERKGIMAGRLWLR